MPHSRSPLDLDLDTMRRLGHRVADAVAEHLATLRDQPVFDAIGRREAERRIATPPPTHGTDFDTLLTTLRQRVFAHAAREPHPGFIAYVPSCPTFPAVLGDWLATGYNFFAGVWPMASGPNELELVVLDWFREWLGLPVGSSGILTSGGSAANLLAMIAARDAAVRDDHGRLARLTVYMSEQTHSAAIRAAWMAGLPRANVRLVPSDDAFRLSIGALASAIARDRNDGLLPLMVVANGGTTNTGAVDPLPEVAELCAREGLWMHVDAAYGGFSVLTEHGRRALAGIERADSVTIDPHKWLYVPFECGGLLMRDPHRLRAAFRVSPEYLQDTVAGEEEVNFADYGEQLTRYARALKVWLGVSYFGTDVLRDAIASALAVASHAERIAREHESLEVLAPATLGILCFRVHPAGEDDPVVLDALNERVTAEVVRKGRYLVATTRLRGALAIRICPIGFRTTTRDMDELMDEILEVAKQGR